MQTQTPRQASPDSSNALRSDLASSPSLEKGFTKVNMCLRSNPLRISG